MSDVLDDLKTAAARKWKGDPACQQAGLFARAAAMIEGLQNDIHSCHPGCARAGCVNERLRAELQNSQNKLKASGRTKLREENTQLRAELARLESDGPVMQRGITGDGEPWMGTMREVLEDYKEAATVEASERRRLFGELALAKEDAERWRFARDKATVEEWDILGAAESSIFRDDFIDAARASL
jgi:hypothetical protein